MFKAATILACVLVLAAGCSSTATRPAKAPPPDWEATPEFPPPPDEIMIPPPPVRSPVAPPVSTLGASWISLERWAADRGVGGVYRLSGPPLPAWALTTSSGVFVFRARSLSAQWDNLEIRLGFAPQLIGEQVFVHALDLRKNVEPLLAGLPPVPQAARTIVLDPGHGGASPGARSAFNGGWEKDYTLDWAFRLRALLQAQGWQVFLTRTNDSDVPLSQRVAFAEQRRADLFLSLHFNSSGGGNHQAGVETYCLTPAGLPSSVTRNYDDDVNLVLPNNAFDEQNLQLAMRLHRALLNATGQMDRGVRRARFMTVLQGQQRPAVLLEGGYLSNPAEAQRIADPAFRQQLAEAVAVALGTRMEDGR
ncbi:MAG: N-acetylmuramoyl-L-alanine amidase [Verrucomicrobiae bacterium]|nr:N-acetylmuramoyl-L-alanine amidase [Verrucomicrobiae bacterium]